EPLTPLKLGGGNYEEISSLAYDPASPDRIWFSLGFGKGLFVYHRGGKTVDQIEPPADPGSSSVRALSFNRHGPQDGWYLEARTDDARWVLPLPAGGIDPPKNVGANPPKYVGVSPPKYVGAWKLIERIQDQVALPADKVSRMAAAANKYGIYVSSRWASGPRLKAHLDFLKAQGLNSIVLDFKDDDGYLTYDTKLEEPIRIGAVQKRFAIADIVQTAHANGLYLIGRIVVFRDKQLYKADSSTYAAWDKAAKGPWRYLKKSVDDLTGEETVFQGEYWVDPYSEHVWDYNIDIARELQDAGVDEIQFDYIRFPSDGDIGGITWRYRKPGMGKMEALESFLAKAREYLAIPISTDVYGYCGWARISNWVAQNIEMYSRYVDVIQPMFYPSHFPRDFLGTMDYLPRAKYIYEEGTKRSAYIVEGRSVIRPYVQAFRIGAETSFAPPVYSTYLLNEVHGTLEGAGSGFTLWNASNDYYMVTVPLGPIISQGAEAVR
ncbi:MAG: putative glycoside hydrolase, partial [Spirochaetia bacterium]